MYDIERKILALNNPHISLDPVGIVIHETANNNDTALDEYNYFNRNNVGASAHAFIDWVRIINTIDWHEIAYHAGHTANHMYIGIELCHTTDLWRFNEIWQRATWLCALLCCKALHIRTVSKLNILSHADISNTYYETDHQDPIEYFKSFNKTMDDFRRDVQSMINEMTTPPPSPIPDIPQYKVDGVKYLYKAGYTKELHNPTESVDMGLLGAILLQRDSKQNK